jgi:hypothetical protein
MLCSSSRGKYSPSFKNLWLFGPHLRRVYHDEHWSKDARARFWLRYVETILQALHYGQRWSTFSVESLDSDDVFRPGRRIWPRMIATIRYEMYRELVAKSYRTSRQDFIWGRILPNVFRAMSSSRRWCIGRYRRHYLAVHSQPSSATVMSASMLIPVGFGRRLDCTFAFLEIISTKYPAVSSNPVSKCKIEGVPILQL